MDAATRVATLRATLNRLNHIYYVLGGEAQDGEKPASDSDYDAMYSELLALESRHPELVDPTSPTQRVGSPVAVQNHIKHAQRMLSLKNTYTAQEVIDFIGDNTSVAMEPKIDGVSLKVIYKRGRFHQAVTRGDGVEGEDATASAKTILSLPLALDEPVSVTAVGEVYMTYSVFNALNERLEKAGEDLFANPRNAAAGSLKLKDPAEVASRRLSFVAYGLHTEVSDIETQAGITHYLEGLGFQSVYMLPIVGDGSQTVADQFTVESLEDLTQRIAHADALRRSLDLPTDGLVFKINDLSVQRDLGDGTKYPKHSCAYKFPPERKVTELLNITLQVGRTGKITPVAELKPVPLSGTVVRRASLCNWDEIVRLGINVGDEVAVEKSAEIIPKVMAVATKKVAGVYEAPTTCPCCETKLTKPEGFVDWYCPNPNCHEQVLARLKHATSKGALDIDGCGDALIRELMRHGVRTLSDLFLLKNLTCLKPAARTRFEAEREKAKRAPYWRKLHALGIEGLGTSLCQSIAARWPNIPAALDDAELLRKEIGEVNFKELITWFGNNLKEITLLEDAGFDLDRGTEATGPLVGKVFCITGSMVSGTRDEVVDRIIAAGGASKNSVSKTVNFLVVGADAGRTKTIAAQKQGTKVITEEQLYEMMGVPMPVANTTEEKEY